MGVTVPTFSELYERGQAAGLLQADGKITELSFQDGFMFDILLGIAASLGEELDSNSFRRLLSTFISTAEGAELGTLADDHYGLTPQGSVKALVPLSLSRDDASESLLIPFGALFSGAGGVQFAVSSDVLMLGTSETVTAEAVLAGHTGNVPIGSIGSVVDPGLASAGISVDNEEPAAGGRDAETDDQFRQRVRDFLASLTKGVCAAVEFGAKSVPGVDNVFVDEDAGPPGIVYVADVTGLSNTALVEAVKLELLNWRAAGITFDVVAASVFVPDIDLSLVIPANSSLTSFEIKQRVTTAVLAYVNGLNIGDTLERSEIEQAAKATGVITKATANSPVGDLDPSDGQLFRITAANIVYT